MSYSQQLTPAFPYNSVKPIQLIQNLPVQNFFEWLFGKKVQKFEQGIVLLSPSEQEKLREDLGKHRKSLRFLENEKDMSLFCLGLLNIARYLEKKDCLERAAQFYFYLAKKTPPSIPASVRNEAKERLDLLTGESRDVAAIVEFTASRVLKNIVEPSSIAGMLAASLVGRAAQMLSGKGLLRLAPCLWTRGIGGQSLAGLVGILAETAGFVVAAKTLSPNSYTGEHGSDDLLVVGLAGLIFAGSVRTTSGITNLGIARWCRGTGLLEVATRAILPRIAPFAGVMLAQQIERKLELRKPQNTAMTMMDGLATALQVMGTGIIVQKILGPHLNELHDRMQSEAVKWEPFQSFALRETLNEKIDAFAQFLFPHEQRLATAGVNFSRTSRPRLLEPLTPAKSTIMAMSVFESPSADSLGIRKKIQLEVGKPIVFGKRDQPYLSLPALSTDHLKIFLVHEGGLKRVMAEILDHKGWGIRVQRGSENLPLKKGKPISLRKGDLVRFRDFHTVPWSIITLRISFDEIPSSSGLVLVQQVGDHRDYMQREIEILFSGIRLR